MDILHSCCSSGFGNDPFSGTFPQSTGFPSQTSYPYGVSPSPWQAASPGGAVSGYPGSLTDGTRISPLGQGYGLPGPGGANGAAECCGNSTQQISGLLSQLTQLLQQLTGSTGQAGFSPSALGAGAASSASASAGPFGASAAAAATAGPQAGKKGAKGEKEGKVNDASKAGKNGKGDVQPGPSAKGIPAKYKDNKMAQLIWQESLKAGADPYTMLATAIVESGLNPKAVGDGGTSFGLYQYHIGGALGNRSKEWAFDPLNIIRDEAKRFAQAGANTGREAAAVQRPADQAGYAAKVDSLIAEMKRGA